MKPAKKKKARTQPTKIDWEAAKRWYMDDHKRSLPDVAKEFGVSLWSVKKHSATDSPTWPEARQDLAKQQTATFKTEKQKQLEETDDRHLKQAKSIQNAALNALYVVSERNKKAKDNPKNAIDTNGIYRAAMAMKAGMDYERIVQGLPILISRAETAVTDMTPPSIADAEKALDKLEARKKRLRELRQRSANS